MGKRHAYAIAGLGLLLAIGWLVVSLLVSPERRAVEVTSGVDDAAGEELAEGGLVGGPVSPVPHDRTAPPTARIGDDVVYTPEDVEIFDDVMAWARENRIDTLPIGDIIARTGRLFVGEPYTPHTLELPGPERVVVNLREFDCVTYIENVLALARTIRQGSDSFGEYVRQLRRIRYRGGEIDGYLSRLHYFTEWIEDNEQKDVVTDVTARLGGRPHDEVIDFMSEHADAYRALDGNPERIERIREIERRLTLRTRSWIPQSEIAAVADGIRDGDVIAATSSIDGLDVAHTGFALWQDGRLHLMHAPLVGKELEISQAPLAVRILGIDGQDGIMVARPL